VAEEHRERELKFDVPEGWTPPELDALVPKGGRVETETVHLESTYFDTADRDLLRSRVTLRRRRGDADTGWHLKVPAGTARLELRRPLGPDEDGDVPAELADLTLGLRAAAPLAAIATLTTERAVRRVVDGEGRALAEVVVDDVHGTAVGEAAVITRWREVEVELGEAGDERVLAQLAEHLRGAGAEPAASASKLARALGQPPARAEQLDGLARVVADYLDAQYLVLVGNDVELRRGRNAVHGTRTASRRYRSALRVFAPVMDGARAAHLDAELKWYAEVLGRLRDRHVLREHLDNAVDELPPELVLGPVRTRIHQMLDADLAEAQTVLDRTMAGERYFALLRELRAWHEQPPLALDRPAADARRFLGKADRRLRRRLAAAAHPDTDAGRHHATASATASATDSADHDAAMHRARKAAKRLRYTAELAEPEVGRPAKRIRKRAKKMQERLGARQDSVIAAEFLLRAGRAAGTTPGENGFTFGLLYQRERDAAERAG